MERLNPLNDYAFKQIMEKENLIAFLNAVLNPDDQKKLVSLELLDNNKELIKISSDEEALALYRTREDSVHERANLIYSGKMEGRIEGKIEGKIEDAKNMLAKNLSLALIAEITGLSLEEIKAIQAKINEKTQ
jgi:predicted transposase YdaD